jgi:methylenetetrahydrofolate dehydrogenase (NADP+)/methenyltetrahydrofolate cyclohydrolase
MKYIDCAKYANEILEQVKVTPNKKKLAILTVGNDHASASYVKGKIKDCEYCGIPYQHIMIGDIPSAGSELFTEINLLNANDDVGGIIVQLPLPNLPESFYVDQVRIDKDVDGFRANSPFKPCTPEGIMYILENELGDLTGLNALVIGRGKLVGEPIAKMLLDANCTVTVAHSKTKNLDYILPNYDIIIAAAGKPYLVNLEMCNAKIVIDAGVNRDESGKLCGDCYNFRTDYCHGMKVTPVPGGIGLMTRAMLMKHVAKI